MKNIRLVIDADHLNIDQIHFACYIASLSQSRLTGVFIKNNARDQIPLAKSTFATPDGGARTAADLPGNEYRQARHQQNEDTFRAICDQQGVRASMREDSHQPLEEILAESRYADLLIIGSELAFEPSDQAKPSVFVKEILNAVECPVLIAPRLFEGIEQVVFAYDGNAAAVHAIKQFTYLLPELEDCRLTIVQVIRDGEREDPNTDKLAQLISSHYSNVHFKKLYGRANSELFTHLTDKKKTLVVMGSYGRNAFSSMLIPSTAEPLIRNLDLPFFIAHP